MIIYHFRVLKRSNIHARMSFTHSLVVLIKKWKSFIWNQIGILCFQNKNYCIFRHMYILSIIKLLRLYVAWKFFSLNFPKRTTFFGVTLQNFTFTYIRLSVVIQSNLICLFSTSMIDKAGGGGGPKYFLRFCSPIFCPNQSKHGFK